MVSEIKALAEMLCSELSEIKGLLRRSLAVTSGAGNTAGDLFYQFPESFNNRFLDAGESVKLDLTINRPIRYLSLDIPDGVVCRIFRDNTAWTWAADDAGALEFPAGVWVASMQIEVENFSSVAQSWSIKMIFGRGGA